MKKTIIFISLFVLLSFNIIIIIYNYYSEKNYSYIILDSKNIWQTKDEYTKKISKNRIKKFNYEQAKLYSEKEIDGYFSNEPSFTFYSKNLEEQQNIYSSLIVVGNAKITNYTHLLQNEITKEDENIITRFLSNYSLTFDKDGLYIQKIQLPNNIYLYSVTTYVEYDKEFSVIFMYQNGTSSLVYKNIENSDGSRYSSLNKIIDINNDGYADIILLSDIPNSGGNECYSLYKYNINVNNFEPVINCEG